MKQSYELFYSSGGHVQIKEIRAEIRRMKAEMKERGIKRTSCFNRVEGDTYRFNATMFQLETRLKSLVGEQ